MRVWSSTIRTLIILPPGAELDGQVGGQRPRAGAVVPVGQSAAHRLDALGHADDPVPGADRLGCLRPVGDTVRDGQPQVAGQVLDQQVRARAGAVLVRVGQRLLDDAQRCRVDGAGQLARRALDAHRDGEPVDGEPAHDVVELGEPGRAQRGCVGVAQRRHEVADLGEHGPGGSADRAERALGVVGPRADRGRRRPRVQVDDGDLVGDDVVQVAGDRQAGLGHALPGERLACGLGAVGALARLGELVALRAHGFPECRPEQDGEHMLAGPVPDHRRAGGDDDGDGQREQDRVASAQVLHAGVDGDRDGGRSAGALVAEQRGHDREQERERDDGARPPAAPEQHDRGGGLERDAAGGPVRRGPAVGGHRAREQHPRGGGDVPEPGPRPGRVHRDGRQRRPPARPDAVHVPAVHVSAAHVPAAHVPAVHVPSIAQRARAHVPRGA
nr:hypothetical protein [Xylanimonas allomyrinae]